MFTLVFSITLFLGLIIFKVKGHKVWSQTMSCVFTYNHHMHSLKQGSDFMFRPQTQNYTDENMMTIHLYPHTSSLWILVQHPINTLVCSGKRTKAQPMLSKWSLHHVTYSYTCPPERSPNPIYYDISEGICLISMCLYSTGKIKTEGWSVLLRYFCSLLPSGQCCVRTDPMEGTLVPPPCMSVPPGVP